MNEIGFVLTYLDSYDIEWQCKKNKYKYGETVNVNPNRYRDWTNLRFFFRGIEKYVPRVRKIHIVTCGHVSSWLNAGHPRINVVKHSDYIPKKWLPTFSSCCIDMNLHRIGDLADQFVYFNDDMILTAPVKQTDSFNDGKSGDSVILSPRAYEMTEGLALHIVPIAGTAVINKHFQKKEVLRKNLRQWLNVKYGSGLLRTLSLLTYPHFISFLNLHLPYSYLKSTYRTVWEEEGALLSQSSAHRFREPMDVNHWIFSYWQYASGNFHPRSTRFGKCFQIHSMEGAEKVAEAVKNQKYKVVCLNDGVLKNYVGGHQQHSGLSECWTGYHITKKIFIRKIRQKSRIVFDFPNADAGNFACAISPKTIRMGVAA